MSDQAHADREHSDLVGGSSAERRLACPGSYQMEQKLPPSDARESSTYADEGTALHECMAYILENNIVDLEEVRGMTFGRSETSPDGYVMTNELMRDAIVPCVAFFDDLDDRMQKEGGLAFIVEKRCQLPGIPGAFGTADLICRTDKRTIIVDWKFGAGVPVKAAYTEGEGENAVTRGNSQLLFYGRAAQHTHPEMFFEADKAEIVDPKWLVDLYIVQPRSRHNDGDEIYSHHTASVKELEEFRMRLIRAVAEATDKEPSINRGDHCRFAKCKKICPHFTQPGFALTQMADKLKRQKAESPIADIAVDWPTIYSELLDYAEIAELAVKEIRAGAHAFLETGEQIPGWKLVDKRGTETYVDEAGAIRHVIGMGVAEDQVYDIKTKSPAQMRTLIIDKMEGATKKAKEAAAKAEIAKFTKVISSGTTLAPADDNRQDAIPVSTRVASLADRLAALTGR